MFEVLQEPRNKLISVLDDIRSYMAIVVDIILAFFLKNNNQDDAAIAEQCPEIFHFQWFVCSVLLSQLPNKVEGLFPC